MSNLHGVEWRKSTFSTASGECVEVARGAEAVGVRDSKNPAGPALTVTPTAWIAFIDLAGGASA
ncbi:DUF397 domain-containing protein [Actinophytocola sp.]|uniref:DUF397 domain-containing protein n=1 Tax=Actinophytocola sp. TaxID=1872138 RepID=UPI002ED1AC7E